MLEEIHSRVAEIRIALRKKLSDEARSSLDLELKSLIIEAFKLDEHEKIRNALEESEMNWLKTLAGK